MKRFLSILLVTVMLSAIALSFPVTVSAESLYIRKIVSLVCDDSGSMSGDKWAYANYAMQAFCGMLNSEDQLFITYMRDSQGNSNYVPEKVDLSANGIQTSVDSIRNHSDGGGTPYSAVETAFNKLKSVQDTNPNTQYWLVVITDGQFDRCNGMSKGEIKRFLNEEFKDYTQAVMPNGSNPQVTFLGIGNVEAPDQNQSRGIFTYSASNAAGIIGAMSSMADRISGRTRLQKGDMKKVDDYTVQVSSAIPLLNIAVLVQGSNAKITKAVYSNEAEIPISRKVSLHYPKYADLVGGAFLLGDSQKVIGAGTYYITFDQKIDLDDLVILFEPALEMRMTITINGREITDYNELDQVMEGDKVTISCKIYEMGTDKEIDPSLLPPGTKFEITVTEDGQVVENSSGKEMLLSDYVLKNIVTELKASVIIEGFNPIDFSVKFTPVPYVPKVVYTIKPSFGGNAKSVKYDDIAANKDMTVCFTVYADGTPITDPEAVKALHPVISVSPQGNSGTVSYTGDGKIVFTPNAASMPPANVDSFPVEVTCTIDDGTTASETYTVLVADYEVFSQNAGEKVVKTRFYGNQVGVSFYITKDGVRLDKAAVEKHISVALNEAHSDLKFNVEVAPDGTITVTPYAQEDRPMTVWNWLFNWAYYWKLSGEDVTVTLTHAFGTGQATIDVVDEDLKYIFLNVILPAVLVFGTIGTFLAWLWCVLTKPRYLSSAKLYVGRIKYDSEQKIHVLREFSCVPLDEFNKIKKGNGRLKFKRTADVVEVNGISIRADHKGRIICEMSFPWYKGYVKATDSEFANLVTPDALAKYFERHKRLEIEEFVATETVGDDFNRAMLAAEKRRPKYIAIPDADRGVITEDDRRVINKAKIFIYVNG